MATTFAKNPETAKRSPIPRGLRQRAEALLEENYAFMDSPMFRRKNIDAELFTEDAERALPLTSWYQPTRDDAFENGLSSSTPQLMKADEERLMFQRFNLAKRHPSQLQRKAKRDGLTRELADQIV